MARPRKYPDELRERAVRLVFESKRPTWCLSSDFTLDVVQSEVGRVIATQLCWVVRPRVPAPARARRSLGSRKGRDTIMRKTARRLLERLRVAAGLDRLAAGVRGVRSATRDA
jgi:transposase-like protein